MGSPSVLDGLRKCTEHLKKMPEAEARRIADDYREFCEKYDSEEHSESTSCPTDYESGFSTREIEASVE